ncbi:MAG: hypothetical protein B7X50_09675, partial [Alishewanella sp. 34-51-39]
VTMPLPAFFFALPSCQELDQSLAGMLDFNEHRAEFLILAMLLQSVWKTKRIVQLHGLEDIQPRPSTIFQPISVVMSRSCFLPSGHRPN